MNRRKRKTKPTMPAWRGRLLLGLFVVAAVTLEARLFWLQLVESDELIAEGDQRQLQEVEMSAHRGRLLDRFGEPLGVSTPVDRIVLDPTRIPEDRETIYTLANAVGREGDEVLRAITSRADRRYYRVQSGLAPTDASKVMALGIEGVWREREYKRFYPHTEVTCHVLGFAGAEDVGQEGLELAYDSWLAGESGSKLVQRDERGRIMEDIEQIEPARPGQDIRLSIDLRLQFAGYSALKGAVQASESDSGSIVVIKVDSGEVLAMANQPVCNPNNPEHRASSELHRNRAITDPIEPGSTIKPLVLADALANGHTPDTLYDVPKQLIIDGDVVTEDRSPLGIVTMTEILARSSSVGMAGVALELDPSSVWGTLKSFGIGEPTYSELRGLESRGALNHFSYWDDVAQATLSYGYGLMVTPLQLARAYAAIGSGGLLTEISFVALDEPPETVRVIDEEIAAQLIEMLEVVVSDQGTAQRAAIPGYRVAGKTGTAERPVAGGYSDDEYRAIFAGLAPASDPEFAIVVVLDNPRGQAYHGGDIAAPVFAKVMQTALQLYGIAPDAVSEPVLLSQVEARQ